MRIRSPRTTSRTLPTQPYPLPVSARSVAPKDCSGKKRIRVPRQLKVWALEEQAEKSLSDQKTAELLTDLLVKMKLLGRGRSISRTAVVAWRKRLKGVTQAEAGQSLSFRRPLYKELYEATKRAITIQIERCERKLSGVRLTQGDVRRVGGMLLPVLMEALEKRIVEALENGDVRSADSFRPALCAYSRCCLSRGWARRTCEEIVIEGTISGSERLKRTPFSQLPFPDLNALGECASHGLSFIHAVNALPLTSAPLRRRTSHLDVQLARSRVRIEEWELSRLLEEGWLTDSVVYGYCALLVKRNKNRWLRTSVPKLWVMDPILLCKILEEIRRRGPEGFLQEAKRKRRYSELLSDTAQAGKL